MKLLAILVIVGMASAWVKEMENENPHGMMEMTPDQERYYEGDMVMNAYDREDLVGGSTYTSVSNTWPKQGEYVTIPYENTITTSLAASRIAEAFANYKKYTCIRFRRRTANDKAYLKFVPGGGCSSNVGYRAGRFNTITLHVTGCMRIGTVMHEIAHSLGVLHEQSRKDRDDHVIIQKANINPRAIRNFDKYTHLNSHNTAYDFKSMMHYGAKAFSTNGQITIKTKDPKMQNVIGQRSEMSAIDKLQINAMYKCTKYPGGNGNGGGSVTAAPPKPKPPTKAPPTAAPACTDIKGTKSCTKWAGAGFCKIGNRYYSWMKKYCAKACGHCGTVCRDILGSRCAGWTKYCNSTNAGNKAFMKKNCAKTCKVC